MRHSAYEPGTPYNVRKYCTLHRSTPEQMAIRATQLGDVELLTALVPTQVNPSNPMSVDTGNQSFDRFKLKDVLLICAAVYGHHDIIHYLRDRYDYNLGTLKIARDEQCKVDCNCLSTQSIVKSILNEVH